MMTLSNTFELSSKSGFVPDVKNILANTDLTNNTDGRYTQLSVDHPYTFVGYTSDFSATC